MGNFLVRYASRVVIYDRRAVIRLATGLGLMNPIKKLSQITLVIAGQRVQSSKCVLLCGVSIKYLRPSQRMK